MPNAATQIYSGRNPSDLPVYGVADAARYLRLSPATLRSWAAGRTYPLSNGQGSSDPLFRVPAGEGLLLSFHNLMEAHVLRALRFNHRIAMREIRIALTYAQREFNIDRLLIDERLRAGPGNFFLDEYGKLINLGKSGQLAMRLMLEAHLKRLDRGTDGLPVRFYPIPEHNVDADRVIVLDPRLSFGRPVLVNRGISTATIAERIDAGESTSRVAEDYGINQKDVEEAIVYERAA